MWRRGSLIIALVAITAALTVGAGVALAASVQGGSGDDTLYGTPNRDNINPFGGSDVVYALGGNDDVRHSYGDDKILGGSGNDTLRGGFDNDEIWGGPGRDLIDCAYLESRDKGEAYDIAHAVRGEDTVVDCKTVLWDDTTGDTTRLDPDGNPTG